MDGDAPETAIQQELNTVEADLEDLRNTAEGLRRQIGDRDAEPTDAAERAALITAAEEQEALAETLAARRDRLRELVEQQG